MLRVVPGLAAVRAALIIGTALVIAGPAADALSSPAAGVGLAFGLLAVELVLHIVVAASNPGLCEPQIVLVGEDGIARVQPTQSAEAIVSWDGSAGPESVSGGAGASTDLSTAGSGELKHVRWPLRSQGDPSGRYTRRDGSPGRVVLFHRFDPFTSNCIGIGNALPYTALQVMWLINSLLGLASCTARWLGTADISLSGLFWGVLMLVFVPYVAVAAGRVIDHWRCLASNLTAYERRNARRIIYLRNASGQPIQPFNRGSPVQNALELLGVPGQGRVDWCRDPVFAVSELPAHPLRPVLVAKMRELRQRALAGTGGLTDQQRLALALSAAELPETLAAAPAVDDAVGVAGGGQGDSDALLATPGPS